MSTEAATTTTESARQRHGRIVIDWLTTTDRKKIGHLYLATSFAFFLLGGLPAMAMRAEPARPGDPWTAGRRRAARRARQRRPRRRSVRPAAAFAVYPASTARPVQACRAAAAGEWTRRVVPPASSPVHSSS